MLIAKSFLTTKILAFLVACLKGTDNLDIREKSQLAVLNGNSFPIFLFFSFFWILYLTIPFSISPYFFFHFLQWTLWTHLYESSINTSRSRIYKISFRRKYFTVAERTSTLFLWLRHSSANRYWILDQEIKYFMVLAVYIICRFPEIRGRMRKLAALRLDWFEFLAAFWEIIPIKT